MFGLYPARMLNAVKEAIVVRRVHLGGKSALERQGSLALPFPGSRVSGSVVAIAEDFPGQLSTDSTAGEKRRQGVVASPVQQRFPGYVPAPVRSADCRL